LRLNFKNSNFYNKITMKINNNKYTEMKKRMIYVPPTIVVTQVVLEGNIATQSFKKTIDVEKWQDDPEPSVNTNDDIWVNF